MSYLIFIDTNIFLDFYEVDSGDATLPLLKYIDANHSKIITTSEVEMEFKKNRQRVIHKSLAGLKIDRKELISTPAFLRNSKLNASISATQRKLLRQSSSITERAIKILKNPGRSDPVYSTLQRFFKSRQTCHLSRDKKIRYKIRNLARKRFSLGYPPRKESDLSLIDAINWEWIIYCAQNCAHDIVIVSRDRDYGIHHNKDSMLNDWLTQEFKGRVSRKRTIILTQSLAEAFKLASVSVSKEEEVSEEILLANRMSSTQIALGALNLARIEMIESNMRMRLDSIDSNKIQALLVDTMSSMDFGYLNKQTQEFLKYYALSKTSSQESQIDKTIDEIKENNEPTN